MLTPLSRPVSPDQGLNNTTHLFLQKSRVYQHIDVRFHFVRELVSSRTIVVEYVPTSEQRADILTKPLTGSIFQGAQKLSDESALVKVYSAFCDSVLSHE